MADRESSLSSSGNNAVYFKSQLGNPENSGFLELDERWRLYAGKGEDPYFYGPSLPGNSPVFYGRTQTLYQIYSMLQRPTNPACVSLLGERRFGKTSLLNQIYEKLSTVEGLITLYGDAQGWPQCTQEDFFKGVFQAICRVLPPSNHSMNKVVDYLGLREFIQTHASAYRFVLIIDEFEEMAGNENLDATFFSYLRHLGNTHDYRLGYLISSRMSLRDLLTKVEKKASAFDNIFLPPHILGLLTYREAERLIQEPLEKTLNGRSMKNPHTILQRIGEHPAMIQMTMSIFWENWNNKESISTDDVKRIEHGLRTHFKSLLSHRSVTEKKILIKLAAMKMVKRNAEYENLQQRGLISPKGHLFSMGFREQVLRNLPKGKKLEQILGEVNMDTERELNIFESLPNWMELANKVHKAFLSDKSVPA